MTETVPLVIVSGLPCSGKTSLADHLSQKLALPMASKDIFKEVLFDTLGWSDRAWSKHLDVPALALLFSFIEIHVKISCCCIIDHCFDSLSDMQRLVALQDRLGFAVLQVLCHAPGAVLFARFVARSASGKRHPGHCDQSTHDEHRQLLMEREMRPLGTRGRLVKVDTSDFGSVDFDAITADIGAALAEVARLEKCGE